MGRLTILVVGAALAWSAWWFIAASAQQAAVEAWFEDRRADGWQAEYSDITVRGFPNRIDTTISDILLSDPERGTGWQTPFLQVFQLSYKRGHLIVAFAPEQTWILPSGVYELASEGLRASLIEEKGIVVRSNVEAGVLNVSGDRSLALAGLTLALEQQAGTDARYRLAAQAEAIASDRRALPGLAADLDGLRLDATAQLDSPLTRDVFHGERVQPTRIELGLAEYRFGETRLRLAGDVDVGRDGTLDGRVVVQAERWRALLDGAVEAGEIPPALARKLEQGLALVATLSGARDTLDLPLDFDNGRMALGPIPLGKAPKLRLP